MGTASVATQRRGRWGVLAAAGVAYGYCAALVAAGALGHPTTVVLCPFRAATGWPCPFCGGVRACSALARGDLAASLALNAMAVPLAILTTATIVELARRHVRREAFALPRPWLIAWGAVTLIAWIAGLAQHLARQA